MTATTATAIDLFAGWGGFTLAAEAANINVLWAANHSRLAVDAHAANHPDAKHVCQDLNQANFYNVPNHDILLASPACQGHSTASQPKRRRFHDAMRSTAWAVVSAADAKEPRAIVVENVEDFRRWRLYRAWCAALNDLGYSLSENIVVASRHGVPQRRRRLFIIATRSKVPFELDLPKDPEMAFGPCIDWTAGKWASVASKSANVQGRVAKARARGLGDRFLTQHVTGHPGVPLHEPIRTITTTDQWAVVDGDRMRPLTIRENALAMGFPTTYRFPERAGRRDIIRGLGNAVCPPAATQILERVVAAA